MGWKTFKERFNIEHIVWTSEDQIHIGSNYITDLASFNLKTGHFNSDTRDFVSRYYPELMAVDASEILKAIQAVDVFGPSTKVYWFDYNANKIVDDLIEGGLEYPNVTHGGKIYYENEMFTTFRDAVKAAVNDKKKSVEWHTSEIDRLGKEMMKRQDEITKLKLELRVLSDMWHKAPASGDFKMDDGGPVSGDK